jgi:protein TonB
MRKVYSPPPERPSWWVEITLAALLSLGVFLVLPLTQMVSGGARRDLTLMRVEAAQVQAPEPEADEPPPPVEEKAADEPPPQLAESAPPMALNVSLDVAVGSGGAMALGAGFGSGEGPAANDTFDVSDLERKPEAISQVAPVYPASLRKARVEGVVALVFVLNEEGRVEDARVESSSHAEFEAPALEAIRKWRFRPGQKEGKSVKTFLRLPIRFRLSAS